MSPNAAVESASFAQQEPAERPPREEYFFTLYLIRHGEALHNVLEKTAVQHARCFAKQKLGLDGCRDAARIKQMEEAARHFILTRSVLPLNQQAHNTHNAHTDHNAHTAAREQKPQQAGQHCSQEGCSEEGYSEEGCSEECASFGNCGQQLCMYDPPLSHRGLQEAQMASSNIASLAARFRLRPPQQVLASPLRRALMTAQLIFANHTDQPAHTTIPISTTPQLEERRTGMPCDTAWAPSAHAISSHHHPWPVATTHHNTAAAAVSTVHHLLSKFTLQWLHAHDIHATNNRAANRSQTHQTKSTLSESSQSNSSQTDSTQSKIPETKQQLRERTKLLFPILMESLHSTTVQDGDQHNHRSIAIVTHKGYLRELERGPLFNFIQSSQSQSAQSSKKKEEDIPLFQNCEVRVYRLRLSIEPLPSNNHMPDNTTYALCDNNDDSSIIVPMSTYSLSQPESKSIYPDKKHAAIRIENVEHIASSVSNIDKERNVHGWTMGSESRSSSVISTESS